MKCVAVTVLMIVSIVSAGCGPCVFVTDEKACVSAYFNAPRLPKVQIGMTPEEVKRTLGNHEPDRREATSNSESWYYMSDYERELMTKLTFENGKLTRIDQVSWQPPDGNE